MMEYSHGEIGWDVFMLEYKVDSPIDTVLDPDSMESYRKLFSHLWRIKRVASCLGQLWTRMATGSKVSSRVPGNVDLLRCAVPRSYQILVELEQEWHQVRIVLAEMIHFIRQMQSYCQLEVIECSWKILHDFIMKKEGDLDGLIHEHHAYLEKVVKKVLLLSSRSNRVVSCG
jgi:gamma-tubulin complex component 3